MFGINKPRLFAWLLAVAVFSFLVYVFATRTNSVGNDIHAAVPVSADIPAIESTSPFSPEIDAADLRSALTEVCSNAADDSAATKETLEEFEARMETISEQEKSASENLSSSSSAEHLHLAAVLESDPKLRFDLLERAISQSSDPFLVWSAVQLCSEAIEDTPCPLRDWEQLLIAVDGQNSESWVRIAANRYAANEYEAALDAMRFASTAAESRAYWTEMIEMAERGLAAASNLAFLERADMAFGIAASRLPDYVDYLRMCEERSAQSADWAYTCLAYGELVENQGKTMLGVAFSRNIQKLALENLGEVEKAAEIRQQQEQRRQKSIDSIEHRDPAVDRLIFSTPALLSAYLAAIRSVGEETARRQMTTEIDRLLEQQPALACEQVRVRS
ncbi:MAG: hypothetical protein QNJ11_06075 [Woeseiaceae bacterium]|nr:hypothetical protein [Woeseiaceae bacterium]